MADTEFDTQHNNNNGGGGRPILRAGRTAAFKAFRALRMMRADQATNLLSSVPQRVANSAALNSLRHEAQKQERNNNNNNNSSVPAHRRGRKRLVAKKALKVFYHNLVTPILPIAYVVSGAFSEGNATASNQLLATIANSPANALSRWFGKAASSVHIPRFLHQRMIEMLIKVYGIDTSQIEKPISQYNTLQDFFSRRLIPDARPPHPNALLVSPCDGELLRVGEVFSGMMSQASVSVKGNEYPLSDLLGVKMPATPENHRRWFYLFHLRPKDYHRFHAPCDAVVTETLHIPGLLLPVTKTCSNWIPNLFAELERISLLGFRRTENNSHLTPSGFTPFPSNTPRSTTSYAITNNNNNNQNSSSTAAAAASSSSAGSGSSNNGDWKSFPDDVPSLTNANQNQNQQQNNNNNNAQPVFAMVPMGASCVGSISLLFDDRIQTNKTSSLTNFWSLFSSPFRSEEEEKVLADESARKREMLIDHNENEDVEIAFDSPRTPLVEKSHYGSRQGKRTVYGKQQRPEISRGKEVGFFNWGSAIVVVADLPNGHEPCVQNMEEVRVGQPIAAPVSNNSNNNNNNNINNNNNSNNW